MIKKLLVCALPVLMVSLLIFTSREVSASSLVTVNSQGKAVLNVLSSQDGLALEIPKRDSLEVKDLVGENQTDARISLAREGEKVNLSIASAEGDHNLDVTGLESEIVEIEERPQIQKLKISLAGDYFVITQEEVSAVTQLPIIIDPRTAELSVTTESGVKYVSILPAAAVQSLLRARIINDFSPETKIDLQETDTILAYRIVGQKKLNLFNMVDYPIEVESLVSASTGEILKTNEPAWLKIISFMFS